ncbi:MAG TPA: type I secretion system permease/ATPase [Pseudolabrys sp.]|nr:type I secretion system permease/ATPase [Pseudolabrys sp.]
MLSLDGDDPVAIQLRASGRRLTGVAVFSGVVNLLTLSGSLYMLQVYDRVIPSRNVATLFGLSAIVVVAYLLQGYFDALRGRMLARIGALFDIELQPRIHFALVTLPLRGTKPILAQQPLRDLDQVRVFLSGAGPTAFLDMPWIPLFLIALFLFHPAIGVIATCGALAIIAMTLLTEWQSRSAARISMDGNAQRQVLADTLRQNADVIRALGMTGRLAARWSSTNDHYIHHNTRLADVHANLSAAAKVLRFILQSAVLGVGAYLVVIEQASGGIMIASSIMMGRALAPVEVALANWKQLVAAREGIGRLRAVLKVTAAPATPAVVLQRPRHSLTVEGLSVVVPGTQKTVISQLSFGLKAGTGLALLGASAAGKSSLAKALVGIWPAAEGVVRLDGAAIERWSPDDLGRHIGYLPQDVSLFDGTVAMNISRFDDTATSEAILEAARVAGAHEMILRLPDGYDTRVGERGTALSAGQRQRIGLARAVFGRPFLVVLDEPNANLDADGENALAEAIETLRNEQSIVIVVSHRPNALAALNMTMVIYNGRSIAFGPREEVFARVAQSTVRTPGTVRQRRGPHLAAGAAP